FLTSRRLHTRFSRDWSSDVCSSDLDDQSRQTACEGACGWVDGRDTRPGAVGAIRTYRGRHGNGGGGVYPFARGARVAVRAQGLGEREGGVAGAWRVWWGGRTECYAR